MNLPYLTSILNYTPMERKLRDAYQMNHPEDHCTRYVEVAWPNGVKQATEKNYWHYKEQF